MNETSEKSEKRCNHRKAAFGFFGLKQIGLFRHFRGNWNNWISFFFSFLQFLLACFGLEDESTLEAVCSVISGSSNPQRQACSTLDSRSKVAEEGSDVLSPLVVALDDVLHLQGESAAGGERGRSEGAGRNRRWPASRLG